jgi:Ferredoxin
MDVEIKFESEGLSGIVATGTYLFDAARRLGVDIEDECGRIGACDKCKVTIINGRDLLSEPTKAELDLLSAEQIIKGERLSCQAKIVGAGEITVMVERKKPTEEERAEKEKEKKVEDFRKEFEEMPLEKKIAALVELEALAFSETLSFVINSPFKVVDKLMDVMAEFGLKLDREDQARKRPAEHKAEENDAENGSAAKDAEAETPESAKAEEKPENGESEKKDSQKKNEQ